MRQQGSDFIPRATVDTVLSSGKLGHQGVVRTTLGSREVGMAQVLAGQSCQTQENQSWSYSLPGDRSSPSVRSRGDRPVVGKLQADTACKACSHMTQRRIDHPEQRPRELSVRAKTRPESVRSEMESTTAPGINPDTTVEQRGDKLTGRIELHQETNGHYRAKLVDDLRNILAVSTEFESKKAALDGIFTLREIAGTAHISYCNPQETTAEHPPRPHP